MKCVPKVNCDFNGVMTDQTLNLTPDLEMLRVPLIVSSF
jgi:Clip-domain serine protease homolog Scarface